MEIWKDINGYEDYYQISSFGNVRSKDRTVIYSDGKQVKYKGKKRRSSVSEYRMIALSKEGTVRMLKISRLVAKHFLKEKEGRNIVNHIDGNKHNDNLSNLEWVNRSENNLHSFKNGMSKKKNKVAGVWFRKDRKKWECYVYRDNRNIRIGSFNSESEAIKQQKIYLNEHNKNKGAIY